MDKDTMVGNVQLMQTFNRGLVLQYIRKSPRSTRPTIAQETGLAPSSITNIVSYLLKSRLVRECEPESTGLVGRRALPLVLDRDWNKLVCVTVRRGGATLSLMALNGASTLEREICFDGASENVGSVAQAIQKGAQAMRERTGGHTLALCVSVPGMVLNGGRRIHSVEMQWRDADLLSPLSKGLDAPVFVLNVSVSKAISVFKALEARGIPPQNMAYLDVSGGLGVVEVIGGNVRLETVGEIGHTTVDPSGERCFCGNVGCLEGLCSPARVEADARLLTGKALPFSELLALDRAGDTSVRPAFTRCGMYLGIAMTSVAHMLHPSAQYLGDGELSQSETILRTAKEWLRSHAYPQLVDGLALEVVACDAVSERRGQLNFALDRLFDYTSEYCVI